MPILLKPVHRVEMQRVGFSLQINALISIAIYAGLCVHWVPSNIGLQHTGVQYIGVQYWCPATGDVQPVEPSGLWVPLSVHLAKGQYSSHLEAL